MTDNSAEEATNVRNEDVRTPQQHEENDFKSIKTLIAPFREILNVTLDECVLKRIYHITRTVGSPESPFPGLAIYELHTLSADGGFERVKGNEAFPANTSLQLQAAARELNSCDITFHAFLYRLSELLRRIGARVDWYILRATPLFGMQYDTAKFEAPVHSVFCITSASGSEFIADFTIEQFGYGEEYWFMDKYHYLLECTKDTKYWVLGEQDTAEAREARMEYESAVQLVTALRSVYDAINWMQVRRIPADDQLEWVRTHACEALERGLDLKPSSE